MEKGHRVSGASRLLDVANAAGVSLRTASRVLNDDPRVAADTRQRVRTAMLDLRFQPDEMARSLRAGTDTAIGFVVAKSASKTYCGASLLRSSARSSAATGPSTCARTPSKTRWSKPPTSGRRAAFPSTRGRG